MMAFRLPPLPAIRVFEAAARHLSFTKAGEELGMTQAAVSYQIRLLEERIGEPLFVRKPRQVTLSPVGLQLAPRITDIFQRLQATFESALQPRHDTLTVSATSTVATAWLAHRIGRFQLENPDLAFRMITTREFTDFSTGEADIGIRAGCGQWDGLISHQLMPITFTPMLSPKLAESIGGITRPEDLLRLPIIDPSDPWWPAWCIAAGVDPADLDGRTPARMGDQIIEASVAMSGGGVAILTSSFYEQELASGRLIQPFPIVGDLGESFWLVYSEARRNAPRIKRFRDWILNEVEGM